MRIVFTCPCGNKLEIEAESLFMAEKAAEQAGWKKWPDTARSWVRPDWICPECLEMPNENS
mgnify:CR=1 FL=1